MSKDRFGLTLKQASFVQAYLYDEKCKGNASASYRKVYNAENMQDSTVHTEACLLLQNQKVSKRIQQLSEETEEKNQLKSLSLRQKVMDSLLLESQTASSDSARIQALNLLGKTIPHFFTPEIIQSDQKISLNSAEKDLQTAISKALADGKVVNLLNNNDIESHIVGDSKEGSRKGYKN